MASKLQYVLLLVTDKNANNIVTIVKKKGPQFLLGKHTFPGGKVEPGENLLQAASRELAEECALQIAPKHWTLVQSDDFADYELHTLFAVAFDIEQAQQADYEPVDVTVIKEAVAACAKSPQMYSPDFLKNIALALDTHKHHRSIIEFEHQAAMAGNFAWA